MHWSCGRARPPVPTVSSSVETPSGHRRPLPRTEKGSTRGRRHLGSPRSDHADPKSHCEEVSRSMPHGANSPRLGPGTNSRFCSRQSAICVCLDGPAQRAAGLATVTQQPHGLILNCFQTLHRSWGGMWGVPGGKRLLLRCISGGCFSRSTSSRGTTTRLPP